MWCLLQIIQLFSRYFSNKEQISIHLIPSLLHLQRHLCVTFWNSHHQQLKYSNTYFPSIQENTKFFQTHGTIILTDLYLRLWQTVRHLDLQFRKFENKISKKPRCVIQVLKKLKWYVFMICFFVGWYIIHFEFFFNVFWSNVTKPPSIIYVMQFY